MQRGRSLAALSHADPLHSKLPKVLLMLQILHYLEGPKLWEVWYIPYYGVMQGLYHQPSDLGLGLRACLTDRLKV